MKHPAVREWGRLKGRVIYSSQGLALAWREEHSFRFWTYVNGVSAILICLLPVDPILRVMVLALGVLILAAECFNTAIERIVNHISPDPHPLAKAAKDAGSAGVAVTAVAAGIAWVGAIWSLF